MVLTRGSALLTTALAGCLAGTPGGEPTEPEPEPEPPGTPTLESSFRVESRGCGRGENRARVRFENGTAVVDGIIGGSNTCETAVLESVTLREGTLRAEVVTTMAETGTPACGQCLTDIEYVLRVRYGSATLDEVVVVHDGEVVADVTGPANE